MPFCGPDFENLSPASSSPISDYIPLAGALFEVKIPLELHRSATGSFVPPRPWYSNKSNPPLPSLPYYHSQHSLASTVQDQICKLISGGRTNWKEPPITYIQKLSLKILASKYWFAKLIILSNCSKDLDINWTWDSLGGKCRDFNSHNSLAFLIK